MIGSSREEFYKLAAENYANTAILDKKTASVHVEGTTDIVFWRRIFKKFYPKGDFNFIAYSKSYSEGNSNSMALASGSMHCLSYKPYLSDKFFICIDSDERYLREEEDINIKNYIFQTYTYSIENHYCYSSKLNFACIIATGLDKVYLPKLVNNFFDFRVFLKRYSNIIYELFVWHIYFYETDICELYIIPFNNIITIKGKIPFNQVKNNGKGLLYRLNDKVNSKLHKLLKEYPDVDLKPTKKKLAELGVTKDTVYLFIRGHNLLGFVSKIGERCCEYLLSIEKKKVQYDNHSINEIHKKTRSFKNIIQRKIEFKEKYFCMEKIKKDIYYHFGLNPKNADDKSEVTSDSKKGITI